MRRISNKDTFLVKFYILISFPVIGTLGVLGISSFLDEGFETPDIFSTIFLLFFLAAGAIIIDYAVRLKEVYIVGDALLIKGLKKKERIPFSDIKAVRFHRLIFRINRPFVIVFKKPTLFGSKIYVYPTITDKNNKIDFTEGWDIKEYLEELIKGKSNGPEQPGNLRSTTES